MGPLGEGPRAAGIDPAKGRARDVRKVVLSEPGGADCVMGPLGEGPRAAGIDPAKGRARDARKAVLSEPGGAGC